MKILGINFSYNKTLADRDNYYNLAIDCRALLNIWNQSWLSLAGKNPSIQIISCIETCICSMNGINFGQFCKGNEIFT